MIYTSEAEFERALIQELTKYGWEKEVLKRPSEKDLLKNWANESERLQTACAIISLSVGK